MARRRDFSASAGSARASSIVLFVCGMMAAPVHGGTQEPAAPPAPPAAAPCVPAGAQPDANYQMNVGDMPALLRVGDTLTLQIDKPVKAEEVVAYCFDGEPITSPRLETGAVTTLTVTVPGDPKTPVLPPAAHTLTVVLKSGKVIETPLIAPVRLTGLAVDLANRALSPNATFGVSVGEDLSQGEVPITFDRLEPPPAPSAPSGDTAPKPVPAKPRVIEADDTKSGNYAKRLLLVVRPETPELKRIFTANSKHVLTIANPDSQKAMLTFSVPDTVRPV